MTTLVLRRLAAAGALAAVVVACGSEGQVAEFGIEPEPDAPALPADDGLDVADAPPPEEVPPADAVLFPGGWPEAAAFIAREAEAGRPTVVNLFASWCAPCRAEMPMLLRARDEHPQVTFLGIDHLDPRDAGQEFVTELGIDFPTIHDPEGDVAFAVGARGMPTTVAFDRQGELAGRVIGELSQASLEQLLDAVA